ncbi:hypothetical protein CUMW_132410 [Citrus unshiu]|uniref:Uncharacterized protein n=1 Tax=Citrus unshiu TaxID=55188 RepID=A0A2H5PGF9_CITUN|nr:hypothetical protein CUMW_132410 [Citrus unshiu]
MAGIHHHNGCFEDGLTMRVKKILYDESSSGNLVQNQPCRTFLMGLHLNQSSAEIKLIINGTHVTINCAKLPMMLRSLVRLVTALVSQPSATVTTLLYYRSLLPRNLNLERLVHREFLDRENDLFHFLINVLTCFW